MENDNDIVPVSIFDIYPCPDVHQGVGAAQGFLVLLKGNVDERVVPITIGQFEGQALAMAIRKKSPGMPCSCCKMEQTSQILAKPPARK